MSEKDFDTSKIIYKQIDRVLRVASHDLEDFSEGGTKIDAKTWSHRMRFSASFFHSFLKGVMPEEEHARIYNKAQEIGEKRVDKKDSTWKKFFVAEELFERDIKWLSDNNMIFEQSDSLVIIDEQQEEDNKLEKPGSKVQEEEV